MIYLLRCGESGPVKIGSVAYASDLPRRLQYMQIAHWEVLRLIRVWRGGRADEIAMHLRFQDLRIRGEWFSFSRTMLGDVGLEVVDLSEFVTKADAPQTVSDVVKRLGGAGDVARFCRTNRVTVSWWMRSNQIPEDRRAALVARAHEMGLHGITTAALGSMVPVNGAVKRIGSRPGQTRAA